MKPIRIVVAMEPVAKGRPRVSFHNGKVRTYTPEKTQEAEAFLKARLLKHREECFPPHMPVRLSVVFYRVKSRWGVKGEDMPVRRADLDNYIKWCIDSLNGILVTEDAQITTIRAAKRFSPTGKPFLTIRLEEDSQRGDEDGEGISS